VTALPGQLPVLVDFRLTDPQNNIDFFYNENFYYNGDFHKRFSLTNLSNYINVDISNLSPSLEKIIIVPLDNFVPASITTVKFTLDGSPDPDYYWEIPMKKIFIWNVHEGFISKLKKMELKTSSITEILINVYLISATDPPPVV
jgi:hypothetical protein